MDFLISFVKRRINKDESIAMGASYPKSSKELGDEGKFAKLGCSQSHSVPTTSPFSGNLKNIKGVL